jgi:hypothetical protein
MKQLRVDFHVRRYEGLRRAAVILGYVVAALLLLLAASNWREAKKLEHDAEAKRQAWALESKQREEAGAQLLAEETRQRELDKLAAPWLAMAQFPWEAVLLSVEGLSLNGLQVKDLRVSAETGRVELTIFAQDLAVVNAALAHLNAGQEEQPAALAWTLERAQMKQGDRSSGGFEVLITRSFAEL